MGHQSYTSIVTIMHNVDNKSGLITKGAELVQFMYVIWLMHLCILYVTFFLALHPYVFMGIVAHWATTGN